MAKEGFDRISKDKSTNKFPNADKLFHKLWEVMEDSFDEFHINKVAFLNRTYTEYEQITEIHLEEVKQFVADFYKWACSVVSQKGGIDSDEAEFKIKKLLRLKIKLLQMYKQQKLKKEHFSEKGRPFSEIWSHIFEFSGDREMNLIKLYYYRGQTCYLENFAAWMEAVQKGFDRVPKDSATNEFPKAEELYHKLWEEMEDSFTEFHDNVVEGLNKYYSGFLKIENLECEKVKQIVAQYYKWACDIVSQKGTTITNEVENKLKELLSI